MSRTTLYIFIAISILITMFLFYIDEGYYNFNWMRNRGNWGAFVIYLIPVFLGQLLIYRLIPLRYNTNGRVLVSVLTGTTLGLLFVIKIIFSHL